MKLLIIEQINSSVLLSVALIIQIVCNANVEDKREQRKLVSTTNTAVETHISPNETKKMKSSLLSSANTSSTHDDIKITSRVTSNSSSADSASSTTPSKQFGPAHITPLDSGAVRRGFYVFVGLTIVVMAYIIFRSLRLNKSRAQMVRKYGVLAHLQDVEMRPLPLEEEDDEDTTVFDASNALNNSVQHQNS